MKFSNIDSFLNALETRMDQLEPDDITSATNIDSDFTDEEYIKFGSIVDEAKALCDSQEDITDYICNRLTDLGYSDDEITRILDYEGI